MSDYELLEPKHPRARDSSKQTVNRDILVMACQKFSVMNCVCVIPKENSLNYPDSLLR